MNRYCLLLAGGAWLITVAVSQGKDSIQTKNGAFPGDIVSISTLEVKLNQNGTEKDIPINQIETIFYDNEPTTLKNAKKAVLSGHYEDALNILSKFNGKDISRKEILEDVEFYRAWSKAKLALSQSENISEAGKGLISFMKNSPESYHYFQACETTGDLFAADKSYDKAKEYYEKLSKSPWPDYQMRAAVLVGRMLIAQEKYDEALKFFEIALGNNTDDQFTRPQQQAAKIGKSAALLAMKRDDEAVRLINSTIEQTDSEDAAMLAQCYNILGRALRQTGKDQDALFAFLRVDLLYSTNSDAHAEALYNLAELWDKLHKPDRAARARQTLEQQYKNSVWAKKSR